VTTHGFSFRPRVVKRILPGTYRISILATEPLGFQLVGPGISRHTRVLLEHLLPHNYATNTAWTVRLRRGIYRYRAIGPYPGNLHPASGSFQVP
jgi:hypothetical protein